MTSLARQLGNPAAVDRSSNRQAVAAVENFLQAGAFAAGLEQFEAASERVHRLRSIKVRSARYWPSSHSMRKE
jgi:hypothetical protein